MTDREAFEAWVGEHMPDVSLLHEGVNPRSYRLLGVRRMYGAWQAAIKAEREAILATIDDVDEPAWYGYENPNSFDDGKRAVAAAIRARDTR